MSIGGVIIVILIGLIPLALGIILLAGLLMILKDSKEEKEVKKDGMVRTNKG